MDFAPTVMDLGSPVVWTPPPPPQGATLREVLTHIFYDRRRLMAALLLGLLLTALATWLAPKRYVAEAQLLVRLGREYVYVPEVGNADSGTPVAYDREQTLQAEARILTSRDTLETALDAVGVTTLYPEIAQGDGGAAAQRTQALLKLEKALDAELLKGSNLLQVAFKHSDAAMSARMLTAIIDAYLAKRAGVLNSAALGDVESETLKRRQALETVEAELSAFKAQHGIRSFDAEMALLLQERSQIEQRESDNRLALAQASGRMQSLQSRLPGLRGTVTLSSETVSSDAADHARKLLLDLRLKERDLTSKFSDQNLKVQDVRADLARTERYLKELEAAPPMAVRTGRSPARDVAEADLLRAQTDARQASAGVATLANRREAIEARMALLSASEARLRTLERDRRLAEANYEGAAKRLRDESTLADLDRKRRNSIGVVQAPAVPLQAQSLKPLVAVLGVFVTLCAMLLVAFLSALWRDTYLLPEQLQRDLDVPLLAAIPRSGE